MFRLLHTQFLARPEEKHDNPQSIQCPSRYSDKACRKQVILADIQTQLAEYVILADIQTEPAEFKSKTLIIWTNVVVAAVAAVVSSEK